MATQTLKLSTTAIGTLTAVQVSASLSAADTASINQGIIDDQAIVSSTSFGASASAIQGGIIFTGVTTTTLSTITSVSIVSPSGATIAALAAGQQLTGFGLTPGTTVLSVGTTTIQMSTAPLTGQSSGAFIAVQNSMKSCFGNPTYITIPNRGVLKLLPGDVVAKDQSGWPIVVSKEAIAWQGSPWILT